MMIPAFKELIQRDKGSEGDYRGSFKKKATREISYIWLCLDWRSPFFTYSPDARNLEALRTQSLSPEDIDPSVQEAYDEYKKILQESSRSYKTYCAMVKSLDQLDRYFEEVDFQKVDKMGKQKYSVQDYTATVGKTSAAYDAVERFKAKMMEELRNQITARNNTTLGKREEEYAFQNKKDRNWVESAPQHLQLAAPDAVWEDAS